MAYAQQKELRLYNGPAPGSEDWNWEEKISTRNSINLKAVYNVVHPSLTVFAPEPGKGNGTALIVCPGGGMHFLAIDHEGTKVAKWLVKKGVTVFVLKYRVFHISHDNPVDEMINTKDPAAWDREAEPYIPLSIADGRQAITYVRQHATEFQVAPDRIGIMGFSAGGTIAASAGFQYTAANRPDFIAPIYAYMPDSFMSTVPADAPPMFLACTTEDDLGLTTHSLSLYNKWYAAKRPVEMHLYEKGYHGFGMGIKDTTTEGWIEQFEKWLALRGLMKPVNK